MVCILSTSPALGKHAVCTGFPWFDPPSSHLCQVSVIRAANQEHRTEERNKSLTESEQHCVSLTLGSKQTHKPSSQYWVNCPQEGT